MLKAVQSFYVVGLVSEWEMMQSCKCSAPVTLNVDFRGIALPSIPWIPEQATVYSNKGMTRDLKSDSMKERLSD